MKNLHSKFITASIITLIIFTGSLSAQNNNLGIGTATPDASAMLEILSSNKGLLVPRMTSTERLAIPSPANALLVYDTDSRDYFYYKQPLSTWVNLSNAYTEVDADPTNELQQLSQSGDTIFISKANYIVVPGISSLAQPKPINK